MYSSPKILAFLLAGGVTTLHPAARPLAAIGAQLVAQAQKATLKPASARAPDIPFNYESQAEGELLQLANSARRQAGAPPLTLDAGLSQAARVHAEAMLEAHELSHQFSGEASLPQRLAAMTSLQLDSEGENVAVDFDAQHGHEHLMLSPPHRENLLNPAFNVVGLGVIRSGDRLYIVQDFGHALPTYSETAWKDGVAAAVNQARRQAGLADLRRRDQSVADQAACSMAQADKLGTAPVRQLAEQYTVLSYTGLRPEALPNQAAHAIASRDLQGFSIGACYARTATYPTGAYWVVLTLQ